MIVLSRCFACARFFSLCFLFSTAISFTWAADETTPVALTTPAGNTSEIVLGNEENTTVSTSSEVPVTTTAVLPTITPSETEETLTNNSITDYNEFGEVDSGKVAGIVIGVVGGLALAGALVAFCVYKQYVRHNVKSMNFDNPVYRKTTEDQFTLEKNQYQPTRSYPATLEPLTNPGTNEFV